MTQLKEDIEHSLSARKSTIEKFDFIGAMMKSLEEFSKHLTDLYCTPRLPEPMWKTLTATTDIPWRSDMSTVECLISEIATSFKNYNRNK